MAGVLVGVGLSNSCLAANRLHILLDPGHTPAQGGATGIRGVREVHYNDNFSQKLALALRADGHRVTSTRTPSEEISLDQRAELANNSGADLFLSIHHDSAQAHYLEQFEVSGASAWRTKNPIRGYSVFVSRINPCYEASLAYAKSIAEQILVLGRKPTLHHAESIPGENRELLDSRLGVYRFDELLVLRKTRIPALLLEVGVIVDAQDELYVRSLGHQDAMIRAIVQALR